MSRTIEAMAAHLVRPPKWLAARAPTGQLIAEWQDGPETISGYASHKLRLTLASRKWEAGTRKLATPAPPLPISHFPLPTISATLGLSAKEECI